ncbi:MAG: hypothetical protein H8E20_15830 [Verrucomicrobia bacterium]|nr:hypothetical protein [Verrucomicrobiota bacterium]
MKEIQHLLEAVRQAEKMMWQKARLYSKTKTDAEREEIIRTEMRHQMRTDEEAHPPEPPPNRYRGPVILMVTKEVHDRIYRELYKETLNP